jgi:hypothetical protein
MPMVDTIATAADYADAMMTARKAKNLLFLLILLVLLTQIAIFAIYAYTDYISPRDGSKGGLTVQIDTPKADATTAPATAPGATSVDLGTQKSTVSVTADRIQQLCRWVVGVTDILGFLLPIVLTSVLMLIVAIMLVGRLIGVARVTSAYIWSIALVLLMFPWQAVFDASVWRWSGVLYTWDELLTRGRFMNGGAVGLDTVSGWWRFAGLPILAIFILMMIQVKSGRGMRQALGEVTTDVATVA